MISHQSTSMGTYAIPEKFIKQAIKDFLKSIRDDETIDDWVECGNLSYSGHQKSLGEDTEYLFTIIRQVVKGEDNGSN